MTRKDYVLIADTLNALFREYPRSFGLVERGALTNRFASKLAAENPNFDADRFRAACLKGVE